MVHSSTTRVSPSSILINILIFKHLILIFQFNILGFYSDRIFFFEKKLLGILKENHREKAPSNKTPTLSKSMNMDILVVGTSNQLFI